MFGFLSKKPENQDIAEPEPVDREAEARARVQALKPQLAELDDEMLAFKSKFKVRTDRFSRLLGVECPGIDGYPVVETQWRTLLKKRDALVAQWHQALKAWSEAKTEAKNV